MKLITHNGNFHYDEILSTAILMKIYADEFIELIRTRDMEVIRTGDIVYDVGGVFDVEKKRFDHHMSFFKETFSPEYTIKLSSSGLIYKYYHKELFSLYGFDDVNSEFYSFIVNKIYKEFFMWADANDNGIDIFGDFQERSLADVVKSSNNFEDVLSQKQDEIFMEVVEMVQKDLDNYLKYLFSVYIPELPKVMKAIKNLGTDPILVWPHNVISGDLAYDCVEELNSNLLFYITKKSDVHSISTLPVRKNHFQIRLPLKKEWRGKSGEELKRISGFDDIIFVHATGFCGAARSLETAIEMCKETIRSQQEDIE